LPGFPGKSFNYLKEEGIKVKRKAPEIGKTLVNPVTPYFSGIYQVT